MKNHGAGEMQMIQTPLAWLLVFLACSVLSLESYAAEFSLNGRIDVVNSHKIQALSENHVIVLASMEETLVLDDESNPTHGASGSCAGAIEIKNGNVSGNGLCNFTDLEGDAFVISWIAKSLNEKGGPVGVWEATGGTGKYSEASGSGEYSDVPTDDPRKSAVTLTGNMQF